MSDFKESVKNFSQKYNNVKEKLSNEEQTKNALIMPFFQMLGWDVFNPLEFIPEYTADVGIKKGEKVDYAIMVNDTPVILIEAKAINEKLEKHDSQLFRYFGTTDSKFGILTNGRYYKFYTDLDETNKMDSEPFLVIDMENVKDVQLSELSKFKKENFDVENIMSSAEELKYLNLIKNYFNDQFSELDEDFIKFCLERIFNERKSSNNIEKYKGVISKALNQLINEKVSEKLNKALDSQNSSTNIEEKNEDEIEDEKDNENEIETTEVELEFYSIVKFILQEYIDPNRVNYRDNKSYFNILIDDNIRKWIVRLYVKKSGTMEIVFRDGDKFTIESTLDIKEYLPKLVENISPFIEGK